MSFDGAKVRRFFGLRKRLRQIVCVNSLFVDAYQINTEIRIFSYFLCKVALISGKMRTFVPQINILYIIRYMEEKKNKFMSVVYQLYSLTDGEKNLEEQTGDERPFEFITGFSIALDAFEQQVMKLEKGSKFDFVLQPSEAFGDFEPEGVHKLSRDVFMINGHFDHENIFEGAVITLMDNEDHQFMAKVKKIEEDGVTIDTNHPLAGKTLNFTGTVIENRDATDEEIQHLIKHLTGGCGHHHGGCNCDDCQKEGCEGHHHHDDGCGCGHCH